MSKGARARVCEMHQEQETETSINVALVMSRATTRRHATRNSLVSLKSNVVEGG